MRRKKRTDRSVKQFAAKRHEQKAAEPTDFLNYPGDCQDVVGQTVGPDRFGAYYEAVDAIYELATNSTRVEFRPVYRPGLGGRVRVQQ